MKIQDIFRQMLDTLDGVEHTTGNPSNAVDGTGESMIVAPVDNTDYTEKHTMIPADFSSEDEHDCGCSGECECQDNAGAPDYEEEDAITDIQHLAGLKPIAIVQI
jgi:hypothetical protein